MTTLTNISLLASLPSQNLTATLTNGEFFVENNAGNLLDIFQFDPVNAFLTLAIRSPTSLTTPNPFVLPASMITIEKPGRPDIVLTIGSGSLDPVPIPAALPLFATGIGALGLVGWRKKRKAQAVA